MPPFTTGPSKKLNPLSLATLLLAMSSGIPANAAEPDTREWQAGDHHMHSRFSVGWDRTQTPPAPIIAGDGIYPIPMNTLMARHYGLDWLAATDHGGPNHSKVNFEHAYPEILTSRLVVPEVIQFYAMELNPPGSDHASLIIPHSHGEREQLLELESRYDKLEAWPADPARDEPALMLEALRAMRAMPLPPVVIAHHPSRSAPGPGEYGLYDPAEIRDWNDAAPDVAVGMEGAPGHQARALAPDGTVQRPGVRGFYDGAPTLGGFDPMTARLGGYWDSLLGEGRRWGITANSDSHVNYAEGGEDFWPGQYSKTWVYAEKTYDDILAGLRAGRVFVSTGDLIDALFVNVSGADAQAEIGGELRVPKGSPVKLKIRFRDPAGVNHGGFQPAVTRVDLIAGDVLGPAADRGLDHNPSTRVLKRFGPEDWIQDGEFQVIHFYLGALEKAAYVRVRGTNGTELEPEPDPSGEDPWADLWFYSNAVFMTPE